MAAELDKLDEHLELVKALSERNRARDANSTRIALNPAGKQLEGYVTTQRQSFDAALRRLQAMQDPRRPRPPAVTRTRAHRRWENPGQTETKAATINHGPPSVTKAGVAEATPAGLGIGALGLEEVATESRIAVATEAASSDREPLVETTPELPSDHRDRTDRRECDRARS